MLISPFCFSFWGLRHQPPRLAGLCPWTPLSMTPWPDPIARTPSIVKSWYAYMQIAACLISLSLPPNAMDDVVSFEADNRDAESTI